MNDDIKTAYHEAGHYIAAYVFNSYTHSVSIIPNNDFSGVCTTEERLFYVNMPDKALKHIENEIITLFAGYEAEKHFDTNTCFEGSTSDYEKAKDLLYPLSERLNRDIKDVESELREKTKVFILDNWDKVKVLATALLEEKTLPADEADIVIDSLEYGTYWKDELKKYRCLQQA